MLSLGFFLPTGIMSDWSYGVCTCELDKLSISFSSTFSAIASNRLSCFWTMGDFISTDDSNLVLELVVDLDNLPFWVSIAWELFLYRSLISIVEGLLNLLFSTDSSPLTESSSLSSSSRMVPSFSSASYSSYLGSTGSRLARIDSSFWSSPKFQFPELTCSVNLLVI